MARAFLALGANLPSPAGGPAETLAWATRALAGSPGVELIAASPVYRTRAEGPPQPDYANAVVEVETELEPTALLALGQDLERRMGRVRDEASGDRPRPLDVDLLLHGDRTADGPGLVLPHPRLHRRRFVLVPLAAIAPGVRHPGLKRTAAELLAALPDRGEVGPWEEP